MKQRIAILVSILTLVGVLMTLTTGTSSAGGSSLTLSPASGSHNVDSTFSITVYENATNASVVQADLTYNASQLQFISAVCSSPFADVGSSGGGGNVDLGCFIAGGGVTSGSKAVGTVTFKALVGGSTPSVIHFATSSNLNVNNGGSVTDDWDGNTTGGTYTLVTPAAPTCASLGKVGTYPNCTTPAPATTCASLGKTGTYPNCVAAPKKTTSSSSTTTTVNSSDTAAQVASPATPVEVSKNSSSGDSIYIVTVKVVDSKGKPVSGATVNLGSSTAKSDSNGVASFTGIAAGVYNVSVKSGGGSVLGASTVTVDGTQPTITAQQFEVKLKNNNHTSLYIGIGVVVLIILLIVGLWKGGISGKLMTKFKGGKNAGKSAAGPTVVSAGTSVPTAKTGEDNILKPTVIGPSKS